MPDQQPSSALPLKPVPADSFGAGPYYASPSASSAFATDTRSTWALALGGLLVTFFAANITCLWPRWYSASLLSLGWHASEMVLLSAAVGAAAVRTLWGMMAAPPAASPTRIACILSASWVFLPCVVLLYESDSPWMLAPVAIVGFAMALALRLLLPADPGPSPLPYRGPAALSTLDGLPPGDSPLALACWIAVFTYATVLLASAHELSLAAIPLSIAAFLLTWRWTANSPRAAQAWLGPRPPLRFAIAAIVLTALCIIPFSVGSRGGIFHISHAGGPPAKPRNPQEESSGAGYAGIILYPPPVKKQIVAPAPQSDSFQASAHAKPVLIPFDGQYWYFKLPSSRPSARAHIAHAKPTDVNVHSTDSDPLQMEAHQNLGLPVNLADIAEIDLALTNADTRPGPIDIQLLLADSSAKPIPPLYLAPQSILSSQPMQILLNRPPVRETLRFRIPAHPTLQRFNQITVIFRPSPRRSRVGAKVSIEGFELIPNP
jgi:hypothetical protein